MEVGSRAAAWSVDIDAVALSSGQEISEVVVSMLPFIQNATRTDKRHAYHQSQIV